MQTALVSKRSTGWKGEPGFPFSQAAATVESALRSPRTERTSRILLKTSREEYCKGGKGVSAFKKPRQRRPGVVSPSEHEVKESCIHPKSWQRAEESVPLSRCAADVVPRKREGKNCGASRSPLQKRSGAPRLPGIPEVKPLMHLDRLTAFC